MLEKGILKQTNKADEVSTTNLLILNCLNKKVKTETFQSTMLHETHPIEHDNKK